MTVLLNMDAPGGYLHDNISVETADGIYISVAQGRSNGSPDIAVVRMLPEEALAVAKAILMGVSELREANNGPALGD